MTIQIGSQQFLGMKKEAVRNTAELTPDTTLKVESNTIQPSNEYEDDMIQFGHRDGGNYDRRISKQTVGGEIKGRISNEYIGNLIHAALGNTTSVEEASSGAFKHTSTAQTSVELPTYTMFFSRGEAGVFAVRGCVFNELSIEFGETESNFTAQIMGLDEDKLAGAAKTNVESAIAYTEAGFKYCFGMGTITTADTIALLGSGTEVKVKPGITININNNVEYDVSTGNQGQYLKPSDTYAKLAQVTASFDSITRDSAIYDTFMDGSKKAVEIKFDSENNGGVELGTSSGLYPLLRFRLAKVVLTSTFDVPLEDVISYSVDTGTAIFDTTNGFSAEVYVQNEEASY